MSPAEAIFRLWFSRLFWFLVAAAVTVCIAYLPAGMLFQPNRPGATTARAPILQIRGADSRLVTPAEAELTARPWTWSTASYWRGLQQYNTALVRGRLGEFRINQTGSGRQQTWPVTVGQVVAARWLNSVWIFGAGLLSGLFLGLVLGGISAWSRVGRGLSFTVGVVGLSIPDFVMVIMGQLLAVWAWKAFGLRLYTVGMPGGERHWLLPVLVLSIAPLAYMARRTTAALDEVMRQDYIRTARAMGLHELRIAFGPALRNALPQVMAGLPAVVNVTLSSLVVVELATTWNGLARQLIPESQVPPALVATAGVVFCAWFAVTDGLAHTLRLLSSLRLREVRS